MPRNKGIGAKRKRKAVTSTPKEVTPDKEDEPDVAEGEEAETPEFDDEVIEEATDTVMDTLIEKMIDIDSMVETQVFRLHKREIQAAAAREAIDLKFGSGRNAQRCEESAAWFMAYHEALAELNDFQEEWGIDCPTCGAGPAFCEYCKVDCRCGSSHIRYAWIHGYRCELRCSPASPFIGE